MLGIVMGRDRGRGEEEDGGRRRNGEQDRMRRGWRHLVVRARPVGRRCWRGLVGAIATIPVRAEMLPPIVTAYIHSMRPSLPSTPRPRRTSPILQTQTGRIQHTRLPHRTIHPLQYPVRTRHHDHKSEIARTRKKNIPHGTHSRQSCNSLRHP